MQNIQRQFNVTFKLPDRGKPEDADKGMMIGDAHVDGLEAEFQANFEAQRDELRKQAKQQFFKVQDDCRKTYNLRRRESKSYKVGDLVAIIRTQIGPRLISPD
ncbi:transposon Ty3-G Gag-Pol polyprotein [Nephila pilipes]|uniref:Transposon Ty3-G Gag-Pol polyprotein n=1 Tax=Nephila pilipes TaxID=299642 RepID=A0A8X6UA65_NEPPI|nr:transposon Ty3-G Gag-Pol polyprotein [Nephila pilipes]